MESLRDHALEVWWFQKAALVSFARDIARVLLPG
jgi:hypothetical protein